MFRYTNNSSVGLTLIEVMVAVVVFSMISIAVWTATSQTARTRDIVNHVHDRHHQVRVALELIKRDLSSSFLSRHIGQNEPSHETIFLARDRGNEDQIDFAAFTNVRKYYNAKESDQCEVGYFVAEDKNISGRKNLFRRVSPVMDLDPLEGGQILTLVENIAAFELQYFDLEMNDWKDNWDTTDETADMDLLPHQVRIKLTIFDRNEREVAYGTQISIPMRTPIFLSSGTFVPGPHIPVNK